MRTRNVAVLIALLLTGAVAPKDDTATLAPLGQPQEQLRQEQVQKSDQQAGVSVAHSPGAPPPNFLSTLNGDGEGSDLAARIPLNDPGRNKFAPGTDNVSIGTEAFGTSARPIPVPTGGG